MRHRALIVISVATIVLASGLAARAGFDYSQDFDTLADGVGETNPVAWTNNSTLPGWYLFRQPTASPVALTTYNFGTGGSPDGTFYSFGSASSSERALGGVGSGGGYYGSPGSGAVAGWIAVAFAKVGGGTIFSATVEYDGEQWRNGGNTSTQTMVMEWGVGSAFNTVATWNAPGAAFNFTSPIVGATAASLDGNSALNRVADIGGTISNFAWPDGSLLWFRWIERNDAGNDHGLAIDNFSISVVPELPTFYTCSALIGMAGLYGLSTTYFKRRRAAA